MSNSSGYQVKFSNKATRLLTSVLFASNDSSTNDGLWSAWTVFSSRHSSLIIPKTLQISFQYFLNGERVSLGPYSCEKDKSWIVSVTENGTESEDSSTVLKPELTGNKGAGTTIVTAMSC